MPAPEPADRKGVKARICSIQRLSTEDGPGIRTTVFFAGCPLACRWCQNPETRSSRFEIQWFSTRCIGCRTCATACAQRCVSVDSAGVHVERERCTGCGQCAEACPSHALELTGRTVTVMELADELERDRIYYEHSGGGVTLSGGEPLAQPAFTAHLLERLARAGIPTALDTCGMAPVAALSPALARAALVLYDLKVMDPRAHRALTGQPNETILANFAVVVETVRRRDRPVSLWVRTPLVPGATATRENLLSIGGFLASAAPNEVERWELCAFNNLCRDKYVRLGRTWEYAQTPLLEKGELDELTDCARCSGVNPSIVCVTGAARARAGV